MLCGHTDLKKGFSALVKKESLSHGYVFFGEPQVGKFSFALSLANFLETGDFDISRKMLSEVLIIKESGIDCVREIKNFLWQKPQNSSKRTVIIDNADLLTAEAQSAILKITEEPPEHSLIILIVTNLNNILPPILSRLQKIYFSRISKKDICDFLINNLKIKKEKSEELALVSCGRPGRVMDLINNKEFIDSEEMAQKFLMSSGFNRAQFIKKLVDDQKEKPEILDKFFENLMVILRKDPVKNYKMIRSILSRLFLIKSYNVNKRLQIEAIN
ncbi:MAG: AAA family ATPase [Minisyncoccota bacterium]